MITDTSVRPRQTKYKQAIKASLDKLGHATNNDLLLVLQKTFPELSATTVHRATAGMAARGEIGIGPKDRSGAMRYDSNIRPHDHFNCSNCDILRDADIKQDIAPIIEKSIGDCRISGRLVIAGICKNCIKLTAKEAQ